MSAASANGLPNAPAAPPRVLIVDDERKNRDLLEVMLGGQGYELATVTCGEDALAHVAGRLPDIILLDVMMPGMDGYTVATTLKADAATAHVPIVLLTALDDRNSRAHGLNAGAEDVLTKPVNGAELRQKVRALLQRGA
ncbi:MAG: response regulator [Gemmatimonadaceae bacterium]